ncbi:MAG: hypothetical protein WDZ51_12150 [Pirellulaceae bacterium]
MRLVATLNLGNLDYARHTISCFRAYAHRTAADFWELTHFPRQANYGRSNHWMQVDVIKTFAAQDYYRQLLLIDADMLMSRDCPDLFAICRDKWGVAVDLGRPEVDEAFRRRCARLYGEAPKQGPYFNAGLMIIPLRLARQIAPTLRGPFEDGPTAVNQYLNFRLLDCGELHWLSTDFNWSAPQFEEAARSKQIIHFAGDHKSLIPRYAEW